MTIGAFSKNEPCWKPAGHDVDLGLVRRLTAGDPIDEYRETCSAWCHFCGCDVHKDLGRNTCFFHERDGPWMEARDLLGAGHDIEHDVGYLVIHHHERLAAPASVEENQP